MMAGMGFAFGQLWFRGGDDFGGGGASGFADWDSIGPVDVVSTFSRSAGSGGGNRGW